MRAHSPQRAALVGFVPGGFASTDFGDLAKASVDTGAIS